MIVNAILFINGFALIIGLLILFLDKVISQYGVCQIIINDDKEFSAVGGKSLLRILFENKYFIPSACGGKGTCGYCKVKVTEGGDRALPTEELILTPDEIQEGYRLSCQLKVRNDLRIEVPPEYLEIQEFEGVISEAELVTEDIRRLKIKLQSPTSISFKPGQYVQVRVATEETTEFRAYSIASPPDETSEIELNVKLIPEGIGSTFLHSIEEGESVSFSGPYGDFYLRKDNNYKIVCVAGGVGLAPIKAIVAFWSSHKTNRDIELYYGARTLDDLYDHEYFLELSEKHSNFTYYPALSEPDETWTGKTGFIHLVVDEMLADGNRCEAYLCGPPIMIDSVTDVLKQKGVPQERIYYDKF